MSFKCAYCDRKFTTPDRIMNHLPKCKMRKAQEEITSLRAMLEIETTTKAIQADFIRYLAWCMQCAMTLDPEIHERTVDEILDEEQEVYNDRMQGKRPRPWQKEEEVNG